MTISKIYFLLGSSFHVSNYYYQLLRCWILKYLLWKYQHVAEMNVYVLEYNLARIVLNSCCMKHQGNHWFGTEDWYSETSRKQGYSF